LEHVDPYGDDLELLEEMVGYADEFVWELSNKTSEWKWDAACQGMGPNTFYLEVFKPKENKMRVQTARQICGKCPVQTECLDYALDNCIAFGIWGGLTPVERWKVKRDRQAI
jgi:WhiB family redox-sensing transcriptional regulator